MATLGAGPALLGAPHPTSSKPAQNQLQVYLHMLQGLLHSGIHITDD